MGDTQTPKQYFKEEYKERQNQAKELFGHKVLEVAEEIVALLKTKELTYEEANEVLETSYEALLDNSNFAKL